VSLCLLGTAASAQVPPTVEELMRLIDAQQKLIDEQGRRIDALQKRLDDLAPRTDAATDGQQPKPVSDPRGREPEAPLTSSVKVSSRVRSRFPAATPHSSWAAWFA
jgi:uncharacterized coiled-coil protein SlyX